MEKKPCVNSKTVKTALILPPDANQYGTLFGGSLMAHIDDVAAIAAVKHARKPVVTASTDSVDFLSPVKEIGRASCRERVEISVGDVAVKKKRREMRRDARMTG